MSRQFVGVTFEGPYTSFDELQNRAGVYVILHKDSSADAVIDAGASSAVKSAVENNPGHGCWSKYANGGYCFGVYYTDDESQALGIKKQIRKMYEVPCGHY